jgi:hypothetical protein
MVSLSNIKKAKELLWGYCYKCEYHSERKGCQRPEGVCDVDDAWGWLDAANTGDNIVVDIDNVEIATERLKRYCNSCKFYNDRDGICEKETDKECEVNETLLMINIP